VRSSAAEGERQPGDGDHFTVRAHAAEDVERLGVGASPGGRDDDVQESLIGSSITSTARPHRFLTSAVPGRHTIRTGSWSATARATAA
jgi:hypothetical protein